MENYAANWIAIVLAIAIGFAAMIATFVVSKLLAPRRPSLEKEIAYESGMLPAPLRQFQLQFRYYIFAILFLIFDVEAVFLFPWALVFLEAIPAVFYEMLIFMAVLLFGIAYAWRKGVLQWR